MDLVFTQELFLVLDKVDRRWSFSEDNRFAVELTRGMQNASGCLGQSA